MNFNRFGRTLAVTVALMLLATMAVAQVQTGNLYGTVKDDKGNPLPGVTVNLSGGGAPATQVSNAQGEFRFLSLSPGSYKLTAELEGFSKMDYPNVVVSVGRNTSLELTMNAAVEETITVTTESPLLDTRRISTGATMAKTELEKIPTSRDPWAILQSTPGVLTDRINVGGNESGQQSNYVGPGSGGDQAIWSLDGVVITDMAALGSSTAYYDFDAFEEMQVTTGGADSTVATGGVVLNMVTKRGTNEWRAAGRYITDSKSWQSNSSISKSKLGKAGPWNASSHFPAGDAQAEIKQGNRIDNVKDYGGDIGGPIVKDKLWIWGSYGVQKIDLLTIANVSDKTDLKNYNGKLNWQVTPSNSATAFIFNSEKTKIGRNASPFRPQETTWDQGHFGPKPTTYKFEDTQIFGSNLYLTGLYSKVYGGFQLVAEGHGTALLDTSSVWHNGYLSNYTLRPQSQGKVDLSSFFNTGSVGHELKYGASYRKTEVKSLTVWSGGGYYISADYIDGVHPLLYAARDSKADSENTYTSAYVQDTLTSGNLTINLGLRYDKQKTENIGTSVGAAPLFPDALPATSWPGGGGYTWTNITPRLGLTYALGAERKTLLRASYSRFADQLGAGSTFLNPLYGNGYAYAYLNPGVEPSGNIGPGQILDLNGDGVINGQDVFAFSGNVNPFNGQALQRNAVSSHYSAPISDEILLSAEHSFLPEFVVGLNLTYRKNHNLGETNLLVFDGNPYSAANIGSVGREGTAADYVHRTLTNANNVLPDGTPYVINYWELKPGVASRGGSYLYNGGAEQTFKGASLTFTKRLANHWMARGSLNYADWKWTKLPDYLKADPTCILNSVCKNDDVVVQGSGTASGAKGGVYINSRWSYNLNALYQIAPERPWGFNVAANLTGRQGYPVPYFYRLGYGFRQGIPGYTRVQIDPSVDAFRLDNIHMLDARIEKEFHFGDFGMTFGVDVFNVLNSGFVMQRNPRLRVGYNASVPDPTILPQSDYITEVTSPRIFRLGVRLTWK